AERTTCSRVAAEVELDRDLVAGTEMKASRPVEERRELGQPVALPLRRDRRQFAAHVVRERHYEPPPTGRRLVTTPTPPGRPTATKLTTTRTAITPFDPSGSLYNQRP